MIIQQGIPSSSAELDKTTWCNAFASFLPATWHVNFDPESGPIIKVELVSPYQRKIAVGTKRTYDSAMQVARSLCKSVREVGQLNTTGRRMKHG